MPTPARLVRTTAFKLTLVYLCVFVALSLGLIGYISSTTSRLFDRQLEIALNREIDELANEYRQANLFKVMRTISQRSMRLMRRQRLSIRVRAAIRSPAASPSQMYDPMYSPRPKNPSSPCCLRPAELRPGRAAPRMAKQTVLGGGYRLLVGRDVEDRIEFSTIIKRSIRGAILVVVALALVSWIFLSRSVLRKVDAVAASARQIIAGDLTRRLPVERSGDEFDRLAESVNAMLDEINRLHAGLQDVSQNIAHDLKTPLTRVRNRLDETLRNPPPPDRIEEVLSAAIDECDQLIRTFEALLTIARVESHSAGVTLEATDLSALVADIAEFYEPAAEDAGLALKADIAPNLVILGEPNLLRTMLANLMDNALKYGRCEEGTVELQLKAVGQKAEIVVRDRGPGVDAQDRARLTDRFVRMDAARSKPGAGLGLSMVKAIVGHHGGVLSLEDGAPGFLVRIGFPLGARA